MTTVVKECPRCGPKARWTGDFCDNCLTWACVPAMTPEESAGLERGLQALRQQAESGGWKGKKPDGRPLTIPKR
jgi:hypothetical protein